MLDTDQRTEVPITGLYLGKKLPRTDPRLRFSALRIMKLRKMRANCLPFARRLGAGVDDKARRCRPRKEPIRNRVGAEPLVAALRIVLHQTGNVRGLPNQS